MSRRRRRRRKTPAWIYLVAGINAFSRYQAVKQDGYSQDLRNQDLRAKIAGRSYDNHKKSLEVRIKQAQLENLRLRNKALKDKGNANPAGVPVKRCLNCGALSAATFTACPACGGTLVNEHINP